ncbi:hypothetical protein EH31_03315 [Erythrobacter longus]|uniref:Uncharacterized protein n=2 Tax=Erythrobacter longus TaxID=1044 RepID=A0A074ME20_ERYLO|nr:hypothetical protein EH31_03315 [Erythrobacter longus]
MANAHPALHFGIGLYIALIALVITAVTNRRRVADPISKGKQVDFLIRPLKAVEYLTVLSLAMVGAIALLAAAKSESLFDLGSMLIIFPVLAIGPAIYLSAYRNPTS